MMKCLYHWLWYQLMTPACLQPALRSYVKASKKSRSIMVLAACSHSSGTPNANSKHWFTTSFPQGRYRKAMLGLGVCKNGQAERCATNRPVPVLSHLRQSLCFVFFFHQQSVHWATNRPVPVLSHPCPSLCFVFFFHQQSVHWATNRPVPVLSHLRPSLCSVFFFHQQSVHRATNCV